MKLNLGAVYQLLSPVLDLIIQPFSLLSIEYLCYYPSV